MRGDIRNQYFYGPDRCRFIYERYLYLRNLRWDAEHAIISSQQKNKEEKKNSKGQFIGSILNGTAGLAAPQRKSLSIDHGQSG